MPKRPHVLLITCDQLRKDALGCHGNRAVQTPTLDGLAASGTRYERAYTASSWCLPSRSSLVTGRYPHSHGAYSNFRPARLPQGLPNLYTVLGGSGYTTSHVGKCHFAPVPYGEARPDRTLDYQEFDTFYRSLGIDHLDLQDDKQVSVWFRDDYAADLDEAGHLAAYREAVWDKSLRKVFTFPGPAEWHPDAWVGRKARERVESVPADEPQFLWVSFSGPHFPFDPPEEFLGRVDVSRLPEPPQPPEELADPARIHHQSYYGPGPAGIEGGVGSLLDADHWRRLYHHYFANVALIDDEVGALLAAVSDRLGDDVLVVFTADHGEMLGHHGIWGKNDCFYEGVLNVPLFVRRPGQAVGSVDVGAMVTTVDVFPTVLDCAGLAPVAVDGRSLAAEGGGGHEFVLSEGEGFLVVTDGEHKLVRIHRPQSRLSDGPESFLELFDLRSDPEERISVAAVPSYAGRLARLQQAALDQLLRSALP